MTYSINPITRFMAIEKLSGQIILSQSAANKTWNGMNVVLKKYHLLKNLVAVGALQKVQGV